MLRWLRRGAEWFLRTRIGRRIDGRIRYRDTALRAPVGGGEFLMCDFCAWYTSDPGIMSSSTPPPIPPLISGATPAERFQHLTQPSTIASILTMRKDPASLKAELREMRNLVVADFIIEQIDNSLTGMSAYLGDLIRGSSTQPVMCPLGGCLRDGH